MLDILIFYLYFIFFLKVILFHKLDEIYYYHVYVLINQMFFFYHCKCVKSKFLSSLVYYFILLQYSFILFLLDNLDKIRIHVTN